MRDQLKAEREVQTEHISFEMGERKKKKKPWCVSLRGDLCCRLRSKLDSGVVETRAGAAAVRHGAALRFHRH